MASPNTWPGGLNLSGTVFSGGGTVAALTDDYVSGTIVFLDTINGSNASSGLAPELPVQTLAQAVTNSSANGIILIGAGSAETLGSSQTLSLAGLHIIGCGAGTSRPRYTCSGTSISMFAPSATGIVIENLYFPSSSGASNQRIGITGGTVEVRDCYFECGGQDTDHAITVAGSGANAYIKGCTFASVASRPFSGLGVTAALADVAVEDCVFDGGSFGWSGDAFRVTGTATRLKIRNVSLIRRSDFNLTPTATSYKAFGLTGDGTSRIVFAA